MQWTLGKLSINLILVEQRFIRYTLPDAVGDRVKSKLWSNFMWIFPWCSTAEVCGPRAGTFQVDVN